MGQELPTSYRTTMAGALRAEDAGAIVRLAGWVHRRRDLGGMVFIDLRDRSGVVQLSLGPDWTEAESLARAPSLGSETVVSVEGEVARRPEGMANRRLATGEVEVHVTRLRCWRGGDAADPGLPGPGRGAAGRGAAAPLPVPGPAPGAAPAGAGAPAPGAAGGAAAPDGRGVLGGGHAHADAAHAGGRPGLPGPEPGPPGRVLRAAPEPADLQAAPDGERVRPLLPDRQVPARRGPARGPPAGVHPDRRRAELRRRGRRAGRRRSGWWRRSGGRCWMWSWRRRSPG
jgi:hypothetical protein